MQKKDLLVTYRLLVLEVNTLERQSRWINQIVGGPEGVRSPQITGMPRGTNNPQAAQIQRADYDKPDETLALLEAKCRELRSMAYKCEIILEGIEDQRARVIMRNYYALGWTDDRIGRLMHLDRSVICRIRTAALEKLDEPV